ncbi:alpha-ketoacid dehydrogenase subunit beta [Conexibacter sp. CPCC 206217]|uniref:alpha-ketoacid dehydrogenase subunit beta n=1 Tax=Conexibacter sp. CPCC 206217 TaxID=3064574 RepID=UPI002717377F|nr:alpha-ketoacid dehydrogenase subunit beta [Conexibacter sp. CPCC 206217]MDO8209561.1 alpha-ketoacid dehydrogenase subunit beta [Conexibacter sp. CPCC 206217]
MPELKFAEAIRAAIDAEMTADENVVVMGEEIGPLGGVFTVTRGLQEKHGEHRVMDSPISENALVGWSIGAAVEGMRPIVEIMFSDFVFLALDQIVNLGAKVRFMSDGQFSVPLVIRMPGGGGTNHGPQHSQSLETLFAHVPGLVVALPSSADDAYWMMRDAVRLDDPVIFLENKNLYFRESAEVDEQGGPRGFGARVRRAGADMTVVSAGRMTGACLHAAEQLAGEGIDCEVVDLRYIWPLDTDTIATSLQKTSRLAIVHEPVEFCGWGAEVAAWAADKQFDQLDAPIARLGSLRSPIPYGTRLEDEVVPTPDRIVDFLRDAAGR